MYYDWQVIEDLAEKQLVLIGASPKKLVDTYTDLLYNAGLSPVALEVEAISICRSLLSEEGSRNPDYKNANYCIIDLGTNNSCITIYSKNTILFTASLPISGRKITETINQKLSIDEDQAEKAKIICGFSEEKAEGIVNHLLTEITEELTDKINKTIEFYNNHFSERGELKNIILCGGEANINGFCEMIGKHTGLTVSIGDPLINLAETREKFAKILTETESISMKIIKNKNNPDNEILTFERDVILSYTTAIGLALRSLLADEFIV
jgi:type IV pilus assembly protein PilM